jgi:formate hydrogenlyase subunit 3/multisubunit Na+/H+ antiporter MnhD subunit
VNPIPGPILLLALPLVVGILTYVVRRWTVLTALLAAATTALLAFLCLRLPLDRSAFVLGQEVAFGRPVVILGQTLQLEPAGQVWLAFTFLLATLLFLAAWPISPGRSFLPFGLALLTLYALVILLQVFALAVLIFGVSATLTVFILQAGQLDSIRGAQRYLLVSLLAVPLLLAAAWMVEPALPGAQNAEAARRVLLPAALGFGLLLAAFPFGTWMPAVAADAPPVVTAFVFTAGQAVALFLAVSFLGQNPWILADSVTVTILQLSGLVMCISGGIMAAVQRDFGRLFGYAALSDLGVLLLALGIGGSQAVTLTLLHVVARSVPIVLMAIALAIVRHRATTDRFEDLRGVARRLPLATAGLMLGGLALAGFPLTAGFPAHWAVYRTMASEQWLWTLLLVASSAGIAIGLLRGLNAMLGANIRNEMARQPVTASLLVLALAALTIALGLYPQLLLDPVHSAAQAFSLF